MLMLLSDYGRRLLLDPEGLTQVLTFPVLVWQGGDRITDNIEPVTNADAHPVVPRPGDPLVVPVRAESTQSRLTGFTVGRSDNNDIILENPSISRFHALIDFESRKSFWRIADAGSRNGTWVDGVKVAREQPIRMKDRSKVRLGDCDFEFFLPESFMIHLARLSGVARGGAN